MKMFNFPFSFINFNFPLKKLFLLHSHHFEFKCEKKYIFFCIAIKINRLPLKLKALLTFSLSVSHTPLVFESPQLCVSFLRYTTKLCCVWEKVTVDDRKPIYMYVFPSHIPHCSMHVCVCKKLFCSFLHVSKMALFPIYIPLQPAFLRCFYLPSSLALSLTAFIS